MKVWPDDKVPGFQSAMESFFKLCGDLSLKILNIMALGLQLEVISAVPYANNFPNSGYLACSVLHPFIHFVFSCSFSTNYRKDEHFSSMIEVDDLRRQILHSILFLFLFL